jgi:hypothetical protein
MIKDSKVFEVIGSIYATRKGFMVCDDFGNLVPINDQTKNMTLHQCDE